MEQSPSWEANRFLARQEIPPFYVTRRFITVVTSARHLSLSWATSPYPTSHFLKIHLKGTCPIQARKIPRTKSHVSFCCLGCTKVSVHVRGLLFVSQNDTFLLLEDVSTSPKPQARGPPFVGFRDCLFCIFAATFYIGSRSSIRNLKTRHAVVTGTHLSRDYRYHEAEERIGTFFKDHAVQAKLLHIWRWDRQYLPKRR